MPRGARIKSESQVYHIILRGINRQQLFYSENDFKIFRSMLQKYKKISGFELYAYCLMGNHVHLLIKVGKEPLHLIFQRLETGFALFHNAKYDRSGHLFQDRFRSEPIEDERAFLAVLRYILRNPVKAGICSKLEDYPYSSAREYLFDTSGITDTEYALSLTSREEMREYLRLANNDEFMDIPDSPGRMSDSSASELIMDTFGCLTPSPGNITNPSERIEFCEAVNKLIAAGVSLRQLSRLTGLSRKLLTSCRETA